MGIAENLILFKNNIPPLVSLIAVSKTKPNENILEAYKANQKDFGENYVQELVTKAQTLPKDIRWHFIGHLQRNKVNEIIPFVYLIHGVDSERLLREINKEAQKINKQVSVLLQVFIAKEETKFGLDEQELKSILEKKSEFPLVKICGLMGMASNTQDNIQIKKEFQFLSSLFEKNKKLNPEFEILSMGMSSDYKLAIECGSNMIRIGSAIFGARVPGNSI